MIKNKKGGERILSIYLFIIYIIVSVGIVSGVFLFYGSGLDGRVAEAGILSDKVIDCLTEQGKLHENVLKDNFDILKFCKFNFEDNSGLYKGNEQYGVRVELFDFDFCNLEEDKIVCSNEIKKIEAGRYDFLEYCDLEGEKIPKCDKKEIYVLNNGMGVLIKITGVAGQTEKNV